MKSSKSVANKVASRYRGNMKNQLLRQITCTASVTSPADIRYSQTVYLIILRTHIILTP